MGGWAFGRTRGGGGRIYSIMFGILGRAYLGLGCYTHIRWLVSDLEAGEGAYIKRRTATGPEMIPRSPCGQANCNIL